MNLRAFRDIAERTVATYVEVFVGLVIAANLGAPHVDRLSVLTTAAWSAIPAALAVVKGALSTLVGDQGSASLVATGVPVDNPLAQAAPGPYVTAGAPNDPPQQGIPQTPGSTP